MHDRLELCNLRLGLGVVRLNLYDLPVVWRGNKRESSAQQVQPSDPAVSHTLERGSEVIDLLVGGGSTEKDLTDGIDMRTVRALCLRQPRE